MNERIKHQGRAMVQETMITKAGLPSLKARAPAALHCILAVVGLGGAWWASQTIGESQPGAAFITLAAVVTLAFFGQPTLRSSMLIRLYLIVYFLPFSVGLGYLRDPFFSWGPPSIRYLTSDPKVMAHVFWVGVAGALGMATGLAWASTKRHVRPRETPSLDLPTMPMHALRLGSTLWLGLGAVGLAWLGSPKGNILHTSYAAAGTASGASQINFNSAALVGYMLILGLWVESETSNRRLAISKQRLLLCLTSFLLVTTQLLPGDRQAATLVVGLAILYITGPNHLGNRTGSRLHPFWQRISRASVPVTLLFVVFLALGGIRFDLQPGGRGVPALSEALERGFEQNTWTAVLRTNVGNSASYVYDPTWQYLGGETYVQYVLSLPPGVLTAALGWERPLESRTGPAWWFEGVGAGGIHIVNVPFRNAGIPGVYGVMLIVGFVLARIEAKSKHGHLGSRLLYAAVGASSLRWFWYGDMNIIRALMLVLLLTIGWRSLLRSRGLRRLMIRPGKGHGILRPSQHREL